MHRLTYMLIVFGILLSPTKSLAIETSCDLVTGASCLWKEGCDCDGDGFVVNNNEKYCHYDECPLDADDKDPDVFGMPSEKNEDGDAWTTKYDCNDKDPCIDKNCDDICVKDDDLDGFAAIVDCDDENPFIFPSSPIPCCACDVVLNVDKQAKYSCEAPPCPYSELNPPPDGLGSPVDGATLEPDVSMDSKVGESEKPDEGIYLPPMDAPANHFAGSGVAPEHPPGCSAKTTQTQSPASTILLLLLFATLVGARRRKNRPTSALHARALVCWIALVALVLTACQTVRPWQREQLSKAPMTFDSDPLENQLEQHFLQYRESATGGFGGSGGGCGCN